MTNTFTDREGWTMLHQLMEPGRNTNKIYNVPVIVSLRRPLNEKELLKKVYDQGGLGIPRSMIEHLIVFLESSGIPYEYYMRETDFEIAGLLKYF